FTLELAAGDFVELVVEQEGVDVVTVVEDPAGEALRFDSPVGARGVEPAALVAASAGRHAVRICAQGEPLSGGRYSLVLERPRAPNDRDRDRALGHRRYAQAQEAYRARRHREAVRGFREALELWRRAGERHGEAWCLYKLGRLAVRVDEPESAAGHFREAARLHGELGQTARRATVLSHLARALGQRGWSHSAAEAYEEMAEAARRAGAEEPYWQAVLGLAYRRHEQGRTLEALQAYRRLREHHRRRGSTERELEMTSQIGKVYRESGDPHHALESFGRALRLARQAGLPEKEADALEDLGRAQLDLDRHRLAARYFETALRIRRSVPDSPGLETTLNNLGRARRFLGRPAEARALFDEALARARAESKRGLEAVILLNLAGIAEDRGDPRRALDHCRSALTLAGEVGRPLSRADALHCVARQESALGRLDAALEAIEASVRYLETLRSRSAVRGLRAGLLADQRRHFELYVELLLARGARDGDPEAVARAFAVTEQVRMRTLLDGFAEAEARIRATADPELLDREGELLADVEELAGRVFRSREASGGDGGRRARELTGRLAALRRELDVVQGELLAGHPGWRALLETPPATVGTVREGLLAAGDTQLLAYFLGEERSHAWVISPDGVAVRELPGRRRIETLVRRAADLLARSDQRHLQAQASLAADELAGAVLGPVADLLEAPRIAVINDGALHHVPLAPLPGPGTGHQGRPVVERHELVELPSATATLALARLRSGGGPYPGELAVLADPVFHRDDPRLPARGGAAPGGPSAGRAASAPSPDRPVPDATTAFPRLAGTAREARSVAALRPPEDVLLALGAAANRRLVTGGGLAGYRVLHFATHAVADPSFSGLILSRFDDGGRPLDGLLRAHEIDRLELRPELVTLSACRTAMGEEVPGEGLLGLSRAFLSAGASRVLASLWPVDDRATAELMTRFYRHLLVDGEPASRALQRAQQSLRESAEWSAPHYWGAFVLQGDWR
ncbi:MAG: CHAT domain-containing protein, partial [Thermoanaerobaculia bacterium]